MAELVTRYSFTGQFLTGAVLFARSALAMENRPIDSLTDSDQAAHRAYVVAAVIQTTASLEGEISEVLRYGPGHHLGSDRVDLSAQKVLFPLAEMLDEQPVLRRYDLVLHVLGLPRLDFGAQPCQDASLLVRLRNEIVHYKSRWGTEMDRESVWRGLRQKGFPRPPFVVGNVNFFPHECLSAATATWAVDTALALLDEFYNRLEVPSPLDAIRGSLAIR